MQIKSVKPVFGENYDLGWIGFTQRGGDIISDGIAWFERWDAYGNIIVEHAFVVAGTDTCVEAHAGSGVTRSNLRKYFSDPGCRVFFRKPVKYSPSMGRSIVQAASRHIGDKYGYNIIFADVLINCITGHWLDKLTCGWWARLVAAILNRPGMVVCSQLASLALQAQPMLSTLGCLNQPAATITPQRLFVDESVFENWADRV